MPSKSKLILFLLLISALWWLGLIFITNSSLFKISYINCNINSQLCPLEITNQLSILTSQPIIFLNINQVQKIINQNYPYYKQIDIKVSSPNQLLINIKINPPIFALYYSPQNTFISVNSDNIVTSIQQSRPDLPILGVDSSQAIAVGERIQSPTLIFGINLYKELGNFNYKTELYQIKSNNLVEVELSPNITVYFSSQKSIIQQVTTLQSILTLPKIQEGNFIIDLRYQKPVIKPNL